MHHGTKGWKKAGRKTMRWNNEEEEYEDLLSEDQNQARWIVKRMKDYGRERSGDKMNRKMGKL